MKTQMTTKHSLFWWFFFIALVLVGGFYGAIKYKMMQPRVIAAENGTIILAKELAKKVEIAFPQYIKNIDFTLTQESTAELDAVIDREIDMAFEAVYAQIPKFADFHYSLVGEYTQLMAIVTDDAGKKALEILFEEVNFNQRLTQSFANIGDDATVIAKKALEKIDNHAKTDFGFTENEVGLINQTLELTQTDVLARFDLGINSVRFAGVGVGVVAIGGLGAQAARLIGKRTSGKVATKLAARTAVKATGIGSGTATGAAVGGVAGSAVPVVGNVVGAAVGGIVGAVAGWLVTDQVIIKVDELLNRTEFEAEIHTAVDEQKVILKQTIQNQYRTQFQEIADNHKQTFKKKITAKDLIFT
jgi:uncharacterized membrane protein